MEAVLLVEDEARIRDIVQDYFAAHGLDCDLARDGEEALDLLRDGKITTGHAKAILAITDEQTRIRVAQQVAETGMTVRQAEKLCAKPAAQEKKPLAKPRDAVASEVELSLQNALGVEVKVDYKDGKGTLSVSFYSKEQLFEFANKLGG